MRKLPQDLDELIAKHSYQDGHEQFSCRCVSVEALAYWMTGHVRVPVEPNDAMQAAGASAIRIETTALNKLWTANAVFRAMINASKGE